MYEVIIIGGGLAGLVSSIDLARRGVKVLLIERKNYPFHRVCGEYVSNETRPFLESLGLNINQLGVAEISRFQFSSPRGRVLNAPLDLGGFGISRYTLDHTLYQIAQQQGAVCLLGKTVEVVRQENEHFVVETTDAHTFTARVVIAAHGKRSKLDASLKRAFFAQRSPYVGVKYHVSYNFPKDLIALHNFQDGYCGISAIEDHKYCLCYLTTRENLRKHGSIARMEEQILWKNPHLRQIFNEAVFLYEKPEVINEISFAPKQCIENGVLMVGDAAGLIAPLCGNGMAMAIHAAKIAAEQTDAFLKGNISHERLEQNYQQLWQQQFARRLWVGRAVQRLFGNVWLSELTLDLFRLSKPLLRKLIAQTHGEVF